METKVSVVIPVYNAERYLRETVGFILNQSLKEIELICVDDGSTDQSLEILNDIMQSDTRVKILQQKNLYAGVARNTGLDAASGKYIMFLDADDIFDLDLLQKMYDQCEKTDAQVAICGANTYYESWGGYLYPKDFLDIDVIPEEEVFAAEDVAEHLFNFTCQAAWNKMFNREFVNNNQIRFMPTQRTNDHYFVYTALSYAQRITIVKEALVHYRKEVENSLQAGLKFDKIDFYTAHLEQLKDLKNRGVESVYRKSFCNRALSSCILNLKKAKNKESYYRLYTALKNEIFYSLGLVNHGRGYYTIKSHFEKMIWILETSVEEAWDQDKEELGRMIPIRSINDYISSSDLKESGDTKESVKIAGIKPLVSIIVPVYNVENYLEECLDSLIGQTLKEIEIICVNDGSTDRSLEILEMYQKKDSRITIINQDNQGLSVARNQGITKATGEYIHFLDSDDYMDLHSYEILYHVAKDNNLDMLQFSAEVFFDPVETRYEKNIFRPNYIRKYDYSQIYTGKELFIEQNLQHEYIPSAALYLLKREFVLKQEVSFIKGLLHEDEVFTMLAMYKAVRVSHQNLLLYKRRVHEGSVMTDENYEKHAKAYIKVLKTFCDFYQSEKIWKDRGYANEYLNYCRKMYDMAWKKINALQNEDKVNAFESYIDSLEMELYLLIERDARMTPARNQAQNNSIKTYQIQNLYKKIKKKDEKLKEIQNGRSYKTGEAILRIPKLILRNKKS